MRLMNVTFLNYTYLHINVYKYNTLAVNVKCNMGLSLFCHELFRLQFFELDGYRLTLISYCGIVTVKLGKINGFLKKSISKYTSHDLQKVSVYITTVH